MQIAVECECQENEGNNIKFMVPFNYDFINISIFDGFDGSDSIVQISKEEFKLIAETIFSMKEIKTNEEVVV